MRTRELAAIEVSQMRGLEIGPLAAPRVRKDQGPVRYLDHASTAGLRRKYVDDPVIKDRLDDIVDVDYVIGENQTISEVVAADAPFDYVIASHVFEHIPDPIGWMQDLTHVLRPGGILSLIIPDKRYSFDINRSLTEVSDLVDAYLRRLRRPSYRQTFDFFSKALGGMVDAHSVWDGTADYSLAVRQDFDDPDMAALDACRTMQRSDQFMDVHCGVYTSDSFLDVFEKLARLNLVDYEIAEFFPTEYNTLEFHVSLRLLDSAGDRERLLALQTASVARAQTGERLAIPTSTGAEARPIMIEVSPLELRALTIKRRSLAQARATLRRRGPDRKAR